MSYSQRLAHLLHGSLIQLRELGPLPTPLPPGYDVNARCDLHSGTSRHTIENCKALKHKVQDLIDSKVISFAPTDPNVNNNPMPPHDGPSVSMLEKYRECSLVKSINEMKTSLTVAKVELLSNYVFLGCLVYCEQCLLNPQRCEDLRNGVQ